MYRPGIARERLLGLCLMGAILFSPIVLAIFDRGADVLIFSIPLIVFYLFGSWAALIVAAGIIIRRHTHHQQKRKKG